MKKLLLFLIFGIQSLIAQTNLSLKDCYHEAIRNHPQAIDKSLYKSISELNIKNIKTNWLPKIDLNGQATYQSDVTHIPDISVPNSPISVKMPQLEKDMYKLTVDLSQNIYDGGLSRKQKLLQSATFAVDSQQVEVELNQLKSQVNQLYFQILLLQNQKQLVESAKNTIKEKIKQIESGVRNGVVLSSTLDVLKVELLKFNEQLIEIDFSISAGMKMLGVLISKDISENTSLILPDVDITQDQTYHRPELVLFNLQKNRLDRNILLSSTERMPRLFSFGQVGYGRPGLNMLNNKFNSFYYVGAGLKWSIWDWKKVNRQKQIFTLQKNLIDSKKAVFEKNITLALQKELSDIYKYNELIKKDNEIIELRSSISKNASLQLTNGTITATDYLTELNSETQSKINLEIHKIQATQAKINYLTLKGDL